MQAQEDMELARRLQEEENNASTFPSISNQGRFGPNPQYHQVTLADITEIFQNYKQHKVHQI